MISTLVYGADGIDRRDDLVTAREAGGVVWVRARDATTAELARVSDAFGIHPLSIEDIQRDVRPKTEEYAGYTFVLVKTAALRRGDTSFDEEIRSQQIGLFVGADWLVTVSISEVPAVARIWAAAEAAEPRFRQFGPDFTAYRIVDRIVDEYFALLDEIEDLIEEIEEGVLEGPDPEVLESLNAVRRDLLSVRKLLWPTREAVGVLARGDPDPIRESTEKYFRDVYDHLVQLVDLTETYRELAGGARDIYQNTLAQSTNEVMKTLTVVATIILPLTLVVGWYGMNFEGSPYNMPELGWRFGYPAVALGMAAMTAVLLLYFRREGWL